MNKILKAFLFYRISVFYNQSDSIYLLCVPVNLQFANSSFTALSYTTHLSLFLIFLAYYTVNQEGSDEYKVDLGNL